MAKELPEPSLPPPSGSRGAVNIHCQQRKGTTMSHLHKNGGNLHEPCVVVVVVVVAAVVVVVVVVLTNVRMCVYPQHRSH